MKFSRLVSTIILVTTFACIFLFVCIFWFYSSADSNTLSLLKDSFSTASGFFGGIATLIAAYIASKLFNDWRHQHNVEIRTDTSKEILKLYEEVFYEMLTIDKFYKKSQFELKRILSKRIPNQQIKTNIWQFQFQKLVSKRNSEKEVSDATIVYRDLEQSINNSIQGIEAKLNWILFRAITLTVFINEPSLLRITKETLDSIQKIMAPLRTQANKTKSSKEFDIMYEKICDDTMQLAEKNTQKVVLVLKEYIEAK